MAYENDLNFTQTNYSGLLIILQRKNKINKRTNVIIIQNYKKNFRQPQTLRYNSLHQYEK